LQAAVARDYLQSGPTRPQVTRQLATESAVYDCLVVVVVVVVVVVCYNVCHKMNAHDRLCLKLSQKVDAGEQYPSGFTQSAFNNVWTERGSASLYTALSSYIVNAIGRVCPSACLSVRFCFIFETN